MSKTKYAQLGAERILFSHPFRQAIRGGDHRSLVALLDCHPDNEEILAGRSISHFYIRPSKHHSRRFFLVLDDGTEVPL